MSCYVNVMSMLCQCYVNVMLMLCVKKNKFLIKVNILNKCYMCYV